MDSQRVVFFRSLSVLFSSGVPITECFGILADQFEEPRWSSLCQMVARGLAVGHPLPSLLKQRADCLNEFHVGMIRLAFQTGRLEAVLARLAELEEKRLKLERRLTSALSYPAVALVVCLTASVLLPPWVLSGLLDTLAASGQALPFPTRILVSFSTALRHPLVWILLVSMVVALGLAGQKLRHHAPSQLLLENSLSRFPYSKALFRTVITLRTAESLSGCLSTGLNPLEALEVTSATVNSRLARAALARSRQALIEGATFAEAFSREPIFDPLLAVGLRSGEESGSVAQSLSSVVQLLEESFESRITVFSSLLEPLVMLVLGGIVGMMVLATLLPMTQFLESL